MTLQQEISLQKHRALIGQHLWALIDEEGDDGRPAVGRLSSQAPDIDGVVYVDGPVLSGELVRVEITGAEAYDLTAKQVAARY